MAIYSDTGLRIPPTDGQNLTFEFIQYQATVFEPFLHIRIASNCQWK